LSPNRPFHLPDNFRAGFHIDDYGVGQELTAFSVRIFNKNHDRKGGRGDPLDDWRAKALEHFPDFRDLIEQEPSPLSLWIELYMVLVRAYDQEPINEEQIGKIYDYAAWCLRQPNTGNNDTDPSSGVAVSFIEDIPLNQRISEDLHRWMSAETFDDCESLFRYMLNDEQFQNFSASFHSKRRQFGGPSRM
jgi:hypothetical protein